MTSESTSKLSAERLALLYQLSQTFNSTLDLDEVLNIVMDEVISATKAERGFLMLREEGGGLTFRAARGMDRDTIEDPQFQISRGVVEGVAESGEPILTSDAQQDARFMGRQSVMSLGLRAILCAPLKIKEQVLGTIYVDNRVHAGLFNEQDLDLLSAIASSAAVAIENARLYQVAVEKGRMERELQMARRVQTSLMPEGTPELPGWGFAGRWLPAREVAGDFYDFIPGRDGSLGLVIADVTDKGMPASLLMALTRSIVRTSLEGAETLADGIARANRLICADSSSGMPVSLFYAQLLADSGEVRYVNAGHNPPLLCRAGEGKPQELARTGMVLGFDQNASYEQGSISLDPGDYLLLYTDGVTDAIDAHKKQFGDNRLRELALELRGNAAEMIAESMLEAIQGFVGGAEPYDDITLLAARRL